MSDAGAPENPSPEETSTPDQARTTDDLETKPAGATGDDIPDAAPATSPKITPADEATPAAAGAGAATQARPEGETPTEGVGVQAAAPADAPGADAAPADHELADGEPTAPAPAAAAAAAADGEPVAPADAAPADAAPADAAPAEAAAEPEPEPEPAPREPDPVRDPIVEQFRAAFGEDLLDSLVVKGDMTVRVANHAWRRTAEWAKSKGFTYFCFLSGIDWLPNADAASRYENTYAASAADEAEATPTERETGYAGGDTRFQALLRLYDVDKKIGITFKADLDDTDPSIESITSVFRGADWHEREAWEMFGFDFPGHPGLRHLYLPGEFEGFPLRKDFPLLARAVKPWPGLVDKEPIPGEDEDEEAAAPA